MAYSNKIYAPMCMRCGKKASERVFNRFNAEIGTFCTPHAKAMVAVLEANEKTAVAEGWAPS